MCISERSRGRLAFPRPPNLQIRTVAVQAVLASVPDLWAAALRGASAFREWIFRAGTMMQNCNAGEENFAIQTRAAAA
jgi:hypothetical protein